MTQKNKYTSKILKIIDEKTLELSKKNYKQIKTSISSLAQSADVNARTLRQNGFPHDIKNNYEGLNYRKYKGIFIDIETWMEERNLEVSQKSA